MVEPKYDSIPSASKIKKKQQILSNSTSEHQILGSYPEYFHNQISPKSSDRLFLMSEGLWPRHLGIEEGFCSFWPSKGIRPPAMEGGKVIGISNFEIS
ncbi:MAG: hypothetical protein B7X86_17055 [Sphingobacteriales bacterium 17-39-43]|nr:MAG: hypothetical protein B7Y24_17150 [Sphingobacteriales bacterium 16-39-50]OZA21950.1 MAG: hypothetical protein B7X86_17055 [Sphingobacteriales bacterium 17-39-43]